MATIGWMGSLWLQRFSRPSGERIVYRQIARQRPERILEVGMGMLARTERVLRLAGRTSGELTFVGLDRFEGRGSGDPPGVSLKDAHRRLNGLGLVRLVPGNPDTSLARSCNQLGKFDLVLVSADNDPRHMERAWFFIHRMLTTEATVLCQPASDRGWITLARGRVDELAARTILRKAG